MMLNMKKHLLFLVLLLLSVMGNASEIGRIRSIVFNPDIYYYGIQGTSVRIHSADDIVTDDADFVLKYHVWGDSLSEEIIQSYTYNFITHVDVITTRAISYSCPLTVRSVSYQDRELIVNATIKKGTPVTQFRDTSIETFCIHAERDDEEVTSDFAALNIENIISGSAEVSKPKISFRDGKLILSCDTKGAFINSKITSTDINDYTTNEIALSGIYNITAYAIKGGYIDSEKTTATLVWLNTSSPTNGIVSEGTINIPARPFLITSDAGIISLDGLYNGDKISVYSIDGKLITSKIATEEPVTLNLSNRIGQLLIIQVNQKTVKILIK